MGRLKNLRTIYLTIQWSWANGLEYPNERLLFGLHILPECQKQTIIKVSLKYKIIEEIESRSKIWK